MSSAEIWKSIARNPNYQVSSLGRVRRATHGKGVKQPGLLKVHRDSGGYCWAQLGDTDKGYVSGLVARAFIGPRPKGLEIDHIDGCQTNNTVSNLEYVTHSENVKRAVARGTIKPPIVRGEANGQAKLKDSEVRKIRKVLALRLSPAETAELRRAITRQFNTSQSTISSIKNGRGRFYVV